jgi:hypothetical protein
MTQVVKGIFSGVSSVLEGLVLSKVEGKGKARPFQTVGDM